MKKYSNNLFILLAFLNVVIIFYFVFKSQSAINFKNQISISSDSVITENQIQEIGNELSSESFKLQLSTDGTRINPNILVENSKGEKLEIRNLIRNGPVLIFFIKNISCNVCLDDELSLLKDALIDTCLRDKVLIFRNFTNKRQKFVFEKEIGITVYSLAENTIGLMAEKKQTPFYFVLTSDLLVNYTYVPNRANEGFSKEYLEIVLKRVNIH